MAIGKDIDQFRTQEPLSGPWGTGMAYSRVYSVSEGEADTIIALAGELALGAAMPATWKTPAPSNAINGPKLQSVQRKSGAGFRVNGNPVSGDVLVCQFIEFDLSTAVANNYGKTRAVRKISESQFEIIYEQWGVALLTTSAGIPAIGATVSGFTFVAIPRLFENQFDGSYHGRFIVRSLYRALKAGAVTVDYKATARVEEAEA